MGVTGVDISHQKCAGEESVPAAGGIAVGAARVPWGNWGSSLAFLLSLQGGKKPAR